MSERIAVATRKGLFFLQQAAGGAWRVESDSFLGIPISALAHDRATGQLFAALLHGHFGPKVHTSSDDGKTWEEIAAPSYPALEGEEAPSVEQIWTLESGGEGALWAGTIPGGLFRSKDGGKSWSLNEPLWSRPERDQWFGGGFDHPGIHTVCIDPRDSSRLVVGVSCGGVWLSEDSGESWALRTDGIRAAYVPPGQADVGAIQDTHRIVQCPTSPDHYWTQHHNGIFRSTDSVASWREIDSLGPSTFGFAVAVHPSDPETAWFVPAINDELRYPVDGKFVVTRTRDGGESAEILDNGLPAARGYDLVYRHALEVDATGERLVMGSTSGGVWTTADGGDDWTLLEDRLPPVYAVKFLS